MSQEFVLTQEENRLAADFSSVTATISPENKAAYDTLLGMHTYKRPHQSRTERRFITRYIIPLGVQKDAFGNYFMWVGKDPTIMWSCHTDTVHSSKGMQRLGFAKNEQEIGVAEKDPSNCLGADDGAGVWLMQQMILAGRPGLYVFHRDEEHGRNGSKHIAKNYAKDLAGIKFCIALDRRAEGSIITHQMNLRCCSDKFVVSLASQLKDGGLPFKADDGGSFTDSASYTDLIGECTNLSVGYTGAHSKFERLDLNYIFKLRDALLSVDPDKLEESRKAGEVERKTYTYYNTSGSNNWNPTVFTDFKGNRYFYHMSDKYWCVKDDTPARNFFAEGGMGSDGFGGEPGYDVSAISKPGHNATGRSVIVYNDGTMVGTKTGTQVGTGVKTGDREQMQQDLEAAFGTDAGADDASIINTGLPAGEAEKLKQALAGGTATRAQEDEEDDWLPMEEGEFKLLTKMVGRNPEFVADLLEQMGYTVNSLRDEILDGMGVCNF